MSLSSKQSTFLSQGYGNRKGQVWLQLRRPSTESQDAYEVIAEMSQDRFGFAPYTMEDVSDTIASSENVVELAKPGDYYQVMREIGGGGGHRLTIKDFKLTIHFKPFFEQRE